LGRQSAANKLFRQLEAHYLICFPSDAYERNWDFNTFCEWVAKRSLKPKVNLTLARRYRGGTSGFLLPALLAIAITAYVVIGANWVGTIICGIIIVALCVIGWGAFADYRYYSGLIKRMSSLT
jgi:hypothetical protein